MTTQRTSFRVYENGGWTEVSEPTPALVRQFVNNGEIGGEIHDAVLMARLQHAFELPPIKAAILIEQAHTAGYIKPGFWDKQNWAPAHPDRT